MPAPMSKGTHDALYKKMADAIDVTDNAVNNVAAVLALKELYTAEAITTEVYVAMLEEVLEATGYELPEAPAEETTPAAEPGQE